MDSLSDQLKFSGRMRDPTVQTHPSPLSPLFPLSHPQQHVSSPPLTSNDDDAEDRFLDEPFDRATAKAIIAYDDMCTKPWKELLLPEWQVPSVAYNIFRPGKRFYSAEEIRAYDRATADAMIGFNTNMNVLSLTMVNWRLQELGSRPAPPDDGRNMFFLGHDAQFPKAKDEDPTPPVPTISSEALENSRQYLNRTKGLRGGGGGVARPAPTRRTGRVDPLSRAGRTRNVEDAPTIEISLFSFAADDDHVVDIFSSAADDDNVVDLFLPPTTASPLVVTSPPPTTVSPQVSNLPPPTPTSPPRARPPRRTSNLPDPLAARQYGGIKRRPPPQRKSKVNARHHEGDEDDIMQEILDEQQRAAQPHKRGEAKAKSFQHPSKKGRQDQAPELEQKPDVSQPTAPKRPRKSGKGTAISYQHPSMKREKKAEKANEDQESARQAMAPASSKKRSREDEKEECPKGKNIKRPRL
jgi:hypothetical protein